MSKWEMVRLGDVFSFIRNGVNIKQGEKSGGIPVTRIESISTGTINPLRFGYAGITDDRYADYYLKDGDILMSHINSEKHLGKSALYKEETIPKIIIHGMNLLCLRTQKALPTYAFYFFNSFHFKKQIPNITKKSVNQASFTVTAFKDLLIPLPPLAEQKKIAAELDKISGLIAKRKSQIKKLDLLVKAKFVEMFGDPVTNPMGWRKAKLGTIAELKIGPFGSLLHKEDYIVGGHALVNPSHIIDSKVETDNNLTINDKKYQEMSAYHLKINDIVLGRRGEMGRCAVVKTDGMLCGTGSLIIRANSHMKPFILQKIISYPTFKQKIENNSVGVTMMNLNVTIVANFDIPLLPAEKQTQFADFVQKVEQTKTAMQKSLVGLETLYKARMQEYFE